MDADLDIAAEWAVLADQIRQKADPGYRQGMQTATRTELLLYGVKVPMLRQLARDWKQAHPQIDRESLMALVDALWQATSQEERVLAVELLEAYRRWIPTLDQENFDRWRRQCSNWALTDPLGSRVLGPWIMAAQEERLPYLETLIGDPDLWSRRLALVASIAVNRRRRGPTIPDLTLALIDRVKAERDPMMSKAVSWALRGMIPRHRDRVAAYLAINQETLAAQVLREVNNKLHTGLKSGRSA